MAGALAIHAVETRPRAPDSLRGNLWQRNGFDLGTTLEAWIKTFFFFFHGRLICSSFSKYRFVKVSLGLSHIYLHPTNSFLSVLGQCLVSFDSLDDFCMAGFGKMCFLSSQINCLLRVKG